MTLYAHTDIVMSRDLNKQTTLTSIFDSNTQLEQVHLQ